MAAVTTPLGAEDRKSSLIVITTSRTMETLGSWSLIENDEFCFAAGTPQRASDARLVYGKSKAQNFTFIGAAPTDTPDTKAMLDARLNMTIQRDRGKAVGIPIDVFFVALGADDIPSLLPVIVSGGAQNEITQVFRQANWLDIDLRSEVESVTYVDARFPLKGSSRAADAVDLCLKAGG